MRPGTQPSDFGQFDPSGEASARPFTPRERQILRAVFSGKTNKEIAHSLQVSEPLVKAVLQQLFAKTGVRTRSQLVRTAIDVGDGGWAFEDRFGQGGAIGRLGDCLTAYAGVIQEARENVNKIAGQFYDALENYYYCTRRTFRSST